MIKAGQIYEFTMGKYVITYVFSQESFNAITSHGYVFSSFDPADGNLIAEYPTWQEAVNSKEFKGE